MKFLSKKNNVIEILKNNVTSVTKESVCYPNRTEVGVGYGMDVWGLVVVVWHIV